jgi:GNAT superfamily N-acetyltransferase
MTAPAEPAIPTGLTLHVPHPDEWARWRAIRLRSLQQDPAAFGSTYEREVAYREDDWRQRLASRSSVLAELDGADVGAGAAFENAPGTLMVVAMWTDPGARGRGVGRAVLGHVVRLAHERGRQAHLWVVEGNPAQRLYESAGFVLDGAREPLREGSALMMCHLVFAGPV